MAADTATLALRLDASGFLSSSRQVAGALDGLGESSAKVQHKVQHLATEGAFAFSGLATSGVRDIGSVLRSVAGLGFAITPIAGTVALIGAAFFEAARHSDEATRKMLDNMHEMEKGFTASALRIRIAAIEMQRDAILARIPNSNAADRFFGNAQVGDAADLNERAGALRVLLAKTEHDKAAKVAVDALKTAEQALNDEYARQKQLADGLSFAIAAYAKHLADEYDLTESLRKIQTGADAAAVHAVREQEKRDLQDIIDKIKEQADAIKKTFDEAKAAAEKARNLRIGAFGGIASGVFSAAGGPLGAIGAGISGGIGGIAGGPVGIAAGAAQGLIGALLSMGGAEAQARAEMLRLQHQTESLTDQYKVMIGTMSSVEARTRAIHREFTELRGGLSAEDVQKMNEQLKDAPKFMKDVGVQLSHLSAQEQLRILMLQQEVAELNKTMQEDLRVRELRALGRTEEADALELALEQQREYDDYRMRGATEATLAALEHVHAIDRINVAMGKLQGKIDELDRTISGLQTFRNSLLLSDAQSPTQQLAEAKRQYEEILKAAQAGDQGAAGRLPAAAQAFLEFSRTVNASGAAFQADFLKVLADTNGLIQLFTDQKSVFEQQLDVLKQIRDGTYQLHEDRTWMPVPGSPGTTIPTVPGGGTTTTTGGGNGDQFAQAQVNATVEGFKQTVGELALLRQEMAENTLQTRRAFDAIATGRRLVS